MSNNIEKMVKKHLDEFIRITEDLRGDEQPSAKLKRSDLKKLCASNESNSKCLKSIMDWGKPWRNTKIFFSDPEYAKNAECIIEKLRKESISYLDAYRDFRKAQLSGEISGLGPAFYTKLIFFCDPKHEGYIMDIFVSKSVNLLMDNKIINIQNRNYVEPKKNTNQVYGHFCEIINDLADYRNWSGEEIELALFSEGGEWREYVRGKYECRFYNK